jgi:GntR family transcriptional regulator, transcriptional repressor for pyruvate dehydrogenase complex
MKPPVAPPQKLAEHIAEQLRGQIIRRELADGEFLPVEAELCTHFGTSRPTMREAFRILEAEGLLKIRRGGRFGPQVQAPDPAIAAKSLGLLLQHQNVDLSAVYDTFLDIAPRAAARLAEAHTDEDLTSLRDQRERVLAASDDGRAFLEESTAFILLVVERAGNPVLAVMCELLAEILRAHRAAMSAYLRARPKVHATRVAEVLASTDQIIAMIEDGDAKVEQFLHGALDSHMRKALQVPMRETIQLV